ncbi:MAG: hypothetical protein ACI4B8_01530 [Candidatus Gastranaerophilaceae bacterium]
MSMSPVNSIEAYNMAASLYVSTSTNLMYTLTDVTIRRLQELNIDVDEVSSEAEAQEIIAEEEAKQTEQTQSAQNAETYYDKQIINDAVQLAEDLGLYVSTDVDILTLMENIQNYLASLEAAVSGNENLEKVVEEYSNRYDYIYSQYMDKKATLSSQVLGSLDVMGSNNIASITM